MWATRDQHSRPSNCKPGKSVNLPPPALKVNASNPIWELCYTGRPQHSETGLSLAPIIHHYFLLFPWQCLIKYPASPTMSPASLHPKMRHNYLQLLNWPLFKTKSVIQWKMGRPTTSALLCEHPRQGEEDTKAAQGQPSQNTQTLHNDYFGLIWLKKYPVQEDTLWPYFVSLKARGKTPGEGMPPTLGGWRASLSSKTGRYWDWAGARTNFVTSSLMWYTKEKSYSLINSSQIINSLSKRLHKLPPVVTS